MSGNWWEDPWDEDFKQILRRARERKPDVQQKRQEHQQSEYASRPSSSAYASRSNVNRMPHVTDAQKVMMAKLALAGWSNMKIAEKLGIPRTTVSYHVRRMRQRGEIEELVSIELQRGQSY